MEENLNEVNMVLNKLIKNNKIKFRFYNSLQELEVVQICENKNEEVTEINFRDIQGEYVEQLREILNKIEEKNK